MVCGLNAQGEWRAVSYRLSLTFCRVGFGCTSSMIHSLSSCPLFQRREDLYSRELCQSNAAFLLDPFLALTTNRPIVVLIAVETVHAASHSGSREPGRYPTRCKPYLVHPTHPTLLPSRSLALNISIVSSSPLTHASAFNQPNIE